MNLLESETRTCLYTRDQAPSGGLQTVFERAGVGLLEMDAEGRVRRVNTALETMLHWPCEDLEEWGVAELTSGEYRELVRRRLQDLIAGRREHFVTELPLRCGDGGHLWVEVTAAAVREPEHGLTGINGVAVNIQSRKDSEAARDRVLGILDATPDVVAMAEPDGTLTYLNPAGLRLLGLPGHRTGLDAPLVPGGLRLGDLAQPRWAVQCLHGEAIPAAIDAGNWQGRSALLDAEDRERPASQVVLSHRNAHGRLQGLSTLIRDLSQEKAMEDELRLLATAFEISQALIITDAQGRIERVNQAFTDITGYSQQEVVGRTPALLKSGYHDEAFFAGMWQALAEEGRWEGQILNRRKSGEVFPEWESITAVTDEVGEVRHYVAVFHELSTQQRLRLEREATTDRLTGLFNRANLERCLERETARARRKGHALTLVLADVDHFKSVNDSHGHATGDQVLQALAETIESSIRRYDCAGRWGGEEFLVLLPDTDLEEGNHVADKLRRAVSGLELPPVGGVTISAGVAAYRAGEKPAELVQRVDRSLYAAKEWGRDRVVAETHLTE